MRDAAYRRKGRDEFARAHKRDTAQARARRDELDRLAQVWEAQTGRRIVVSA